MQQRRLETQRREIDARQARNRELEELWAVDGELMARVRQLEVASTTAWPRERTRHGSR